MGGIGAANIAGSTLQGIGGLGKLITGLKQMVDGKKIQRKLDAQGRPLETTPQAFTETEGLVRSQYLDPRFMGEDEMRQTIEARGANQIKNIQQTAGSGVDALMAYGLANNNTTNQLTDLGIQAAQKQQNDYQQLLSTLGQKAGFQQSQFQNNVMAPYLQSAQQAQALKQSGMTNMFNAINDGANLALGVGQMQDNSKKTDNETAQTNSLLEAIKKMYGGNGGVNLSSDLTGVGQISKTGIYKPITNLMNAFMPKFK